jgi:outer membrane lipopolysaccharide assembly protein LptE/RlpB
MMKTTLTAAFVSAAALGLTACDVDKTQEGSVQAPKYEVSKTQEGQVQMPKYDVKGPDVNVSKTEKQVTVPNVDVKAEKKTIEVPKVDVTTAKEKEQGTAKQ